MWHVAIGWLTVGLTITQAWADEFSGRQLSERWRWVAPAGGSYELRDNALILSVPQREKGFNHWSGVFDAPMFLTDAPAGDWSAETTVHLSDYARDSDFHVGMAVAVSERYLWLWGIFYSATTWRMTRPELWLERTGEARILQTPLSSQIVHLRVEKRGVWLHFFWREQENEAWRHAGQSLIWFAPRQIGLIIKTWGNGRPLSVRFDRFRMEPLPADNTPLTVSAHIQSQKRLNEINPRIYGQFIEHLGRCIYGGIWAEMLRNRKMHGAVQENGVVESWQPFGENARWFADHVDFFVGGQAQRIEGAGEGEHGIVQSGLDLLPKSYVGRVVVKSEGVHAITVSLRDKQGSVLASQTLQGVTNRWRKLSFRLQLPKSVQGAQFAISFRGVGKVWIGAASLMPADNLHGMRKEVIEAIREMKPPIVRWPGGNFVSGYDWRDGIGDPDRRPPRWDRAWGAWEWNDFGTDEFIQFCRLVGAEPYICVNTGEGYEHEAADWMRYCKRKGYTVRYWGIGNEMYGSWQLGHLDATRYALKAILFARAMRHEIPDARLVAVGVDGGGWDNWNATVTRIAGAHFDLIAPHYYQGYNPNDDPRQIYTVVTGAPLHIERMLRETFAIVQQNKPEGKPIRLAFDEWNVWEPHQVQAGGFESFYALRDALFAAGVFHAMHRCSDFVELACLAQTVNVLGAIRTSQTQVLRTPLYWAFWLYVRTTGKWRVACETESPAGTTPVGGATPTVDISATLSEDGKTLFIGLINRHPEREARVQLRIDDFKAKQSVRMWLLWSEQFTDTNTFEQPDRVKPVERTLSLQEVLTVTLPRHSIAILACDKDGD